MSFRKHKKEIKKKFPALTLKKCNADSSKRVRIKMPKELVDEAATVKYMTVYTNKPYQTGLK